MKCKKDGGMWWLLDRLFYQAIYYWEWLGFVIWRLYSRAAPPSTLVLHRSWFISPPLNLTEDLTDKMLVHVNKNYIVGFVFEHSFEWYNFRWHASAFIVLYIMLVQFLVVLIYSSRCPKLASKTCEEITLIVLCKKWSLRISFWVSILFGFSRPPWMYSLRLGE